MGLNIWTTEPSSVYVWTSSVKEVYVWTTKVWPTVQPVSVTFSYTGRTRLGQFLIHKIILLPLNELEVIHLPEVYDRVLST